MLQAKGQMFRSRMDVHSMLGPLFEFVNDSMPRTLARVESNVSLENGSLHCVM